MVEKVRCLEGDNDKALDLYWFIVTVIQEYWDGIKEGLMNFLRELVQMGLLTRVGMLL